MAAWLGKSGVAIVCDQLTAGGRAVLQKAIRRAGWNTEQFHICRWDDVPAGTRALVACGDRALDELTGWKGGKRASAYTRGYLLPSYTGLPVVPTFDPSKVAMGQMKLLGLVMNDLGLALQAAIGARKVCTDPKAIVNYEVGLQALKDLYAEAAANPELLVAFDLETATSWGEDEDESIEFSRDAEDEEQTEEVDAGISEPGSKSRQDANRDSLNLARAQIRTVQFSLRPGTGISCDWSDECRDWVQRIMSLPNPLAGHNSWLFDEPILRNHGISIREGTHDTLWMWHHLQPDLPAHLQGVASLYGMPFPWKHLSGADLDFYGAADVDAVQRIMLGLPQALDRLGLRQGYERYVREFRPVLAAMERRGIPVSKTKLEELRTWLGQEITRMDGELQPLVPSEMKGRKYWKTWPADTKPVVERYKNFLEDFTRKQYETEGKKLTKKALTFVVKPKDLPCPYRLKVSEELGYGWEGDQLYKELDFNPRSSQQILSYIKAKGYPVPLRFKDKEETTSDKELERLEVKTKDPVLALTRSIRAYSKMGNAYAGKVLDDGAIEGGWQPGPDGRLRATITFGPATGQLCLVAGTKIDILRDLSKHPDGINIEDVQIGDWAYTYDDRRNLTLRKVTWAGQTGTKSVIRLHWKRHNGTKSGYLDLTPDHPVRLSTGEYKKAQDLVVGDRTLALTRTIPKQDGYATLHATGNKRIREHKFVAALMLGAEEGKTVHHKDENKLYNHPDNLEVTTAAEHMSEHMLFAGWGSKRRRVCPLLAWGTGYSSFHRYSEWGRSRIYSALHAEKGSLTKVCRKYQLDYSCFNAYLTLLGIDWKSIRVTYYTSRKYKNNHVITAIEELPGRVPVYDLEIDETHNFIANEICVHNSARNPNIMTSPKRRAELANKFRQCIVAEPGHKLVELDYTAFHARTLGLAAKDAAYMKLAAMDVHSFVAGHLVKFPGIETALSLSDSDLKQFLEEIKKKHKDVRNFKAKPAILGIGFRMSKRRLYFECRESYASEAEAGRLIDLLRSLFPKVFKWQDDICDEADRTGRLINSFGACRWFHDVMKWTLRDGRWIKSTSRDAEKATAYLPSSNAHFMLRDKLLQANEKGWLERYGHCNCIHDAVLFHCPEKYVDECVTNIKALLQAPVPQLADPEVAIGGFVCGAEAMIGSDWATMEEVH